MCTLPDLRLPARQRPALPCLHVGPREQGDGAEPGAAPLAPPGPLTQRTLPLPACSWEALEGELAAIGVHPQCWPLPLTLAAVREAEKNPIAQPIPQMPAVKRGTGEGESVVSWAGLAR